MTRVVLGVDWYKAGWVAVRLDDDQPPAVYKARTLEELSKREPRLDCIAIDMPIGLPEDGTREADRLARKYVGPRRQTVFFTPPRPVLAAATYAEANVIAPQYTGGSKISQQAWALRKNISVVEQFAANDGRVIEVHPEVSFRAMAEKTLSHSKTSWNGQNERRELLSSHQIELPPELPEAGDVPVADILDAAAAAWSARRYATDRAASLPQQSDQGARPVIWY